MSSGRFPTKIVLLLLLLPPPPPLDMRWYCCFSDADEIVMILWFSLARFKTRRQEKGTDFQTRKRRFIWSCCVYDWLFDVKYVKYIDMIEKVHWKIPSSNSSKKKPTFPPSSKEEEEKEQKERWERVRVFLCPRRRRRLRWWWEERRAKRRRRRRPFVVLMEEVDPGEYVAMLWGLVVGVGIVEE